jgi:hypothetical protein
MAWQCGQQLRAAQLWRSAELLGISRPLSCDGWLLVLCIITCSCCSATAPSQLLLPCSLPPSRAVADRSHLQSLAAAAAAAGPDSLLAIPTPLLGGALEEVEVHRLGLAAFMQQLQGLAADAAAAQEQLAASLQESEGDLAAALQVSSRV